MVILRVSITQVIFRLLEKLPLWHSCLTGILHLIRQVYSWSWRKRSDVVMPCHIFCTSGSERQAHKVIDTFAFQARGSGSLSQDGEMQGAQLSSASGNFSARTEIGAKKTWVCRRHCSPWLGWVFPLLWASEDSAFTSWRWKLWISLRWENVRRKTPTC